MTQIRSDSEHPAVRCLLSFFAEMNAWEAEMIQFDQRFIGGAGTEADDNRHRNEQRKKLAVIFERYCEAGVNAKRFQGGLQYPAEEPIYDPIREKIVSVTESGEKVTIRTQQVHAYHFKLKYELVKVDGDWKIRDNRKCSFDFETKWKSWDL